MVSWKEGSKQVSFIILEKHDLCWTTKESVPFWRPLDFEWGSPDRPFLKQIEKNEKKEVQETAFLKHYFWSIFDAKMRGLKFLKSGFRIILVANYEI